MLEIREGVGPTAPTGGFAGGAGPAYPFTNLSKFALESRPRKISGILGGKIPGLLITKCNNTQSGHFSYFFII